MVWFSVSETMDACQMTDERVLFIFLKWCQGLWQFFFWICSWVSGKDEPALVYASSYLSWFLFCPIVILSAVVSYHLGMLFNLARLCTVAAWLGSVAQLLYIFSKFYMCPDEMTYSHVCSFLYWILFFLVILLAIICYHILPSSVIIKITCHHLLSSRNA